MARTVVIDLRDFAGQAAGEHPSGRDKVMVWAPEFRASTQGGWTTGPLPRTFYFNGAPVRIPDVEPGQIVIQFHVRQLQGQDTFTVNVPAGSGDVSLAELMADAFEYDPPIISEAQRTLMSAREALNKATKLRDEAEDLRSSAKTDMGKSVAGAKQDLDKAVESAKGDLNKAVETATNSWSSQLTVMQGTVESLLKSTRTSADQILKDHKAQVAKSQKIQQDMQNVLDTISWSGDKLSVNGKQSPSLTGPRGPQGAKGATGDTGPQGETGPQGKVGPRGVQGDVGPRGPEGAKGATGPKGDVGPAGPTGPKGDTGASTWADITGKPSTFPPSTHTHKMSDISDLPGVDTGATGGAIVKRWHSGHITVPEVPDNDTVAASKKYVDTTAFPRKIEITKGEIDLNDYTETGIYHQNMDRSAKGSKNHPSGKAGLLEVFNPDASMIYQRYTDYGNRNNVWTRGLYSNSWSKWQQVSQDGHTHTMSDISDLPKIDTNVSGGALVQRYSNGAILVPDPPPTSTSATSKSYVDSVGNTKADKKYVDSRIQLVSSLPSSPDSDVLYVITE